MADEEADKTPVVKLGTGASVEGAPFACIASRPTWPQKKSSILNKEGGAVIHAPDGPQSLEDVLAEADEMYFDTRRAFVDDVFDVVGHDSVQTD